MHKAQLTFIKLDNMTFNETTLYLEMLMSPPKISFPQMILFLQNHRVKDVYHYAYLLWATVLQGLVICILNVRRNVKDSVRYHK
jgi:hypothetical protein